MSVLNTIFDKVLVLTIQRNTDRHPSVKNHLKEVNFDFWYGIDVPKAFPGIEHVSGIPNDFFIDNTIDKSYVSAWTKGQLGAYTSIKQMVSEVDEKYESALIFEDDFVPVQKDWQKTLQMAVEELPEDWDILLVGYLYDGKGYQLCYNRKWRWLFNIYNGIKKCTGIKGFVKPTPKKYSTHLDRSGTCLGGHAYAISAKGAKMLMEHLTPMRKSGDILIKKLIEDKAIKAYSVYPCLFRQDDAFGSKTEVV